MDSLAPFISDGPILFTLGRAAFLCQPDPPPPVLLAMVAGVTSTDNGRRSYDMPTLLRVVHSVVPESEHPRLRSVLVDKRRPVTAPLLGKAVIWMAEATMGRPTVPFGGWSAGRRKSGRTCVATS